MDHWVAARAAGKDLLVACEACRAVRCITLRGDWADRINEFRQRHPERAAGDM